MGIKNQGSKNAPKDCKIFVYQSSPMLIKEFIEEMFTLPNRENLSHLEY